MWKSVKKWIALGVIALVGLWIAIAALLPFLLAQFLAVRWIPSIAEAFEKADNEEVDRILEAISKEVKGR